MARTSSWVAVALSCAGFVAQAPTGTHGHVYMMAPVSRNLFGTTAFSESSSPLINYCPHCFQSRGPAAVRERGGGAPWPHLNGERAANGNYIESDAVSVRHGICGDPEQTAAEGDNRYGQENSVYPVLETYAEGSILEVKIVVSTWHFGHVEMFVCNSDDQSSGAKGVVNQECFNKYPLDRAADDTEGGPIDPNYPGRYILDPPCRAQETDQTILPGAFPGDVATARFQLPSGLTCSHCVVQMVYYTGNSCQHTGYSEFNPSSWPGKCAPSKGDWINTVVGMCGEGDAYPEEFWNCADIEIAGDGEGSGPSPTPTPPKPTAAPDTKAPADQPVDEPTSAPSGETNGPTDDDAQPTQQPTEGSAEPFDEPSPSPPTTSTLAPATFAPSVAAPMPEGDCSDPVGPFNQCGGGNYAGSTCCRPGYECQELADCWSECRPKEEGCSEGWGQCGGIDWDGPTCCWAGAECVMRSEWYSQCLPEVKN